MEPFLVPDSGPKIGTAASRLLKDYWRGPKYGTSFGPGIRHQFWSYFSAPAVTKNDTVGLPKMGHLLCPKSLTELPEQDELMNQVWHDQGKSNLLADQLPTTFTLTSAATCLRQQLALANRQSLFRRPLAFVHMIACADVVR